MEGVRNWLQLEDSNYLKILRSISIFAIVFGHVGGFWMYPPWSEFLNVFVPVFFFLSGAVSYNGFIREGNVFQYLSRRIIGLLVPYYGICIIAFAVFIIENRAFPVFNVVNLARWVTVTPGNSIMPFPLGQVWFLHTLIVITIISPLLFWLYRKHLLIFVILLCGSLSISAVPMILNFSPSFEIFGQNLFKPAVHLLFFCLGFVVFDSNKFRSPVVSSMIVVVCIAVSVVIVKMFNVNPSYAKHTYSPDLYYVVGSIGAIFLFIFMQPYIVRVFKCFPSFVMNISEFFFKHTFAIYLLHSLSIFFVENVFGLVHPKEKTVLYGVVKLILVLFFTLMLSPLFTSITCVIVNKMRTVLFVYNKVDTSSS